MGVKEMKYRKDIVKTGIITHPETGEPIEFTEDYFLEVVENTRKKNHRPFIPFRHSKNPRDNTGFIESFEVKDGILYGVFNIDDDIGKEYIDKGKIQEVSAGLEGYKLDGNKISGGYINHVCLTVDPLQKGQGPFIQMETGSNTLYLSNNDLKEWGGDTMSEETMKLSLMDKLTLSMESKAALNAENTNLKTAKLEMESQVLELTSKVDTLNSKVLEMEKAETERVEKLELEAVEVLKTEREGIYTLALEAGKYAPGDNDEIEKLGYDNVQLAGYFKGMGVKFNMEKSKPAVDPNEELTGMKAPGQERVVEELRKTGFTDDEIEATY